MVGNTFINNYYDNKPYSKECIFCKCINRFNRDEVKIKGQDKDLKAVLECGVCGEDIILY